MVNESSPEPPPVSQVTQHGRPASGDATKSPLPKPPILASEVLREELAPLEPGNVGLRLWLLGLSCVLVASTLLTHCGVVGTSPLAAPVAGALALVVLSSLLLPYKARGAVVAIAGTAAFVLGLIGRGPLGGLAGPTVLWSAGECARFVAASVLAATLLFRARYRAYSGARILLAGALALALPAATREAVFLTAAPLLGKITAGLAVLAVVVSCIGFMGAGTTAASTVWAVTVLTTFGLDVAIRGIKLESGVQVDLSSVHTGVVFTVVASLVAIGLFKVLATMFARDARRVDVLGAEQEPEAPVEGPD